MDSLFDQMPCFCFTTLEDGKLVSINDTLAHRLEYAKDELTGRKMDALVTMATRIFQQTHFMPLLKMQGFAEEIFVSLLTKSGTEVPVLINAKRVEQDGAEVFMYVGMEVQNRSRFEAELIAARKAAEQALSDNSVLTRAKEELEQHLEELDRQVSLAKKQNEELLQFNKVITHDLQEPIRKMSLFGHMLLRGSSTPAETVAERLLDSVTRIRTVTSGLQQYMWLDETSPKLSVVELGEVLAEEIMRLNAEFPEANLKVEFGKLQPVIADKAQMHVLFYQLLSNVVRFRKPGAEARARLLMHTQELNKYRSLEGRYKYTEFTRLELQDSGIGLQANGAGKAFELFSRLHTEGGIGLGLALCRKIVDMHRGEISIGGKEGEGATVCVLLPARIQEHSRHGSIVT